MRAVPGLKDVRDLRVEYVGPDVLHAGMRIAVPRGIAIEDAAELAERVRRKVHEQTQSGYCFIQLEPATADDPSRVAGSRPSSM